MERLSPGKVSTAHSQSEAARSESPDSVLRWADLVLYKPLAALPSSLQMPSSSSRLFIPWVRCRQCPSGLVSLLLLPKIMSQGRPQAVRRKGLNTFPGCVTQMVETSCLWAYWFCAKRWCMKPSWPLHGAEPQTCFGIRLWPGPTYLAPEYTYFYLLYPDLGRAGLVVDWKAKNHLCPYPNVSTWDILNPEDSGSTLCDSELVHKLLSIALCSPSPAFYLGSCQVGRV